MKNIRKRFLQPKLTRKKRFHWTGLCRFSNRTGGAYGRSFCGRNNIRHRRDIEDVYLEVIEQAKFEIILANAYFFPGLNFRHALLDAAARGVRVVLLLQGKADHLLLHYASHALYGHFLDAGMEIYEYHKSLMHAKEAFLPIVN